MFCIFFTGVNEIFSSLLLAGLESESVTDVSNLYWLYQSHSGILQCEFCMLRGMVILFMSHGMEQLAREIFGICSIIGVYPQQIVNKMPRCVHLYSYLSETEIFLIMVKYLHKLNKCLLSSPNLQKNQSLKDRYTLRINIEVINCKYSHQVRQLTGLCDSEQAAKLRVADVFKMLLHPPLQFTEQGANRILMVEPHSLRQYLKFNNVAANSGKDDSGVVNTCQRTPAYTRSERVHGLDVPMPGSMNAFTPMTKTAQVSNLCVKTDGNKPNAFSFGKNQFYSKFTATLSEQVSSSTGVRVSFKAGSQTQAVCSLKSVDGTTVPNVTDVTSRMFY